MARRYSTIKGAWVVGCGGKMKYQEADEIIFNYSMVCSNESFDQFHDL